MSHSNRTTRIRHILFTSIAITGLLAVPLAFMPAPVEAVSPGYNGKIVFVSNRDGPAGGNSDLYVMDSDGQTQINLSNNPGFTSSPVYSPDGTKIAYYDASGGHKNIFVMDADGSNISQLTSEDPYEETSPSWSPDGTKIAYRTDRDGNFEIYVMTATGADPIRLTNNVDKDEFPKWSPDGSHVVYSHGTYPQRQVYLMDTNGANQRNLTQTASDESYPDWSPKGDQIVFASKRDGNNEIYVMDVDGSHQTRLTNNGFVDYAPTWSPDGKYILFTSNRDGNFEIYRMRADGSDQTNLTKSSGSDDLAYWQPIPNRAPVTTSDTLLLGSTASASVDVLANDTDEEALNPANLSVSTGPTHGTATIKDGKVDYTSAKDYVGADQLTYRICDSFLLDQKCATGVLGITVQAGPAPAMPTITSVGTVQVNGQTKVYYTGHRPTFAGTATPGSTITVGIHSDPITLTTTVDNQGHWSVTPDRDLPNGDHTVTITATKDGASSAALTFVLGVNVGLADTGVPVWPLSAAGIFVLMGTRWYLTRRTSA